MNAIIAATSKTWIDHRHPDAAERDEVWNGEIHMAAVANRRHQNLNFHLQMYLFNHWAVGGLGLVYQEVNLTTPEDEEHWKNNYRIPDLVLLDPPRFHIDKNEYMAGAPLVCVEIYSPGDESYEKLDFYAGLGVPEVWIIHRDTKVPEIYKLADGEYQVVSPDAEGWVISTAVPVAMQSTGTGKLRIQMRNDPTTLAELPDR